MTVTAEVELRQGEDYQPVPYELVMEPIAGKPAGKNFLSIEHQVSGPDDFSPYLDDAYAAERVVRNPLRRGIKLLEFAEMKVVMRQPSTRTAGSTTRAIRKLGGDADLISGMGSSSEAKGESREDSWVAFATQADIIGTRTAEEYGPMFAAASIAKAYNNGKLWQKPPVINLGDGTNEHPSQAYGDMFTIHRRFKRFEGLIAAVVGDHERYRAHRSFMLMAKALGMTVVAVESPAAPVPKHYVDIMGDSLERTYDLDEALRYAHILNIGRNPDEYDGEDESEKERSIQLASDYETWIINHERLQQMRPDGILLHPRPRRNELHPSIDGDPRAADIEQMANLIEMRMAIIAQHMGVSIAEAVDKQDRRSVVVTRFRQLFGRKSHQNAAIPSQRAA